MIFERFFFNCFIFLTCSAVSSCAHPNPIRPHPALECKNNMDIEVKHKD